MRNAVCSKLLLTSPWLEGNFAHGAEFMPAAVMSLTVSAAQALPGATCALNNGLLAHDHLYRLREKVSLVPRVYGHAGHELVRINLSEQTDMMHLLGADLPVEEGSPGEFAW